MWSVGRLGSTRRICRTGGGPERVVSSCSTKGHLPRRTTFSTILRNKNQDQSQGLSSHLRQLPTGRGRSRCQSTTTTAASEATTAAIPEPPLKELRLLAFTTSIPFVGFGIMDNAILIIAGDYIDATLGIYLGMSTLCAAAIGNIISDIFGIGLGTVIEDFCATTLKLPVPNISSAQRTLRSVRAASNLGMAVGMTIGCIIGMFPLLFIDSTKVEQMKKRVQLEDLFQDVLHEAKTLIDAESTCLYVRISLDPTNVKNGSYSDSTLEHFHPAADGEHFYAMKYDLPSHPVSSSSDMKQQGTTPTTSRLLPIGKGIISRAALTGEAWNISDLTKEPDFFPAIQEQYGEIPDHFKHILVVPILDGQGRTIAVLRALNKKKPATTTTTPGLLPTTTTIGRTKHHGFTDKDVQTLKSLASHISVSLQQFFRDEDKDDMRLKDTIRLLKQHGIDDDEQQQQAANSNKKKLNGLLKGGRPNLFPE